MQQVEIIGNQEIVTGHFLLEISGLANIEQIKPGQFFLVSTGSVTTDPLLKIPLAVHNITERSIIFFYYAIGKKTKVLSKKKPGDILEVLGPLGNGYQVDATIKHAVVVGGGHGIAPLYLLTKKLLNENIKVSLFLGASCQSAILLEQEIKTLGVETYIATDDGSCGFKGTVVQLLQANMNKFSSAGIALFGCGPDPMLLALLRVVKELKIKAQISMSSYKACGMGACRGCAVKTKQGYKLCCKDGPVFFAEQLVFEKNG